jgi:hypothetical protein
MDAIIRLLDMGYADTSQWLQNGNSLKEPTMTAKTLCATAITLALLGFASTSQAACECACVNGQTKAICQWATETPPVCAPRVCQLAPPAVPSVFAPTVPPIGARNCTQKQVLNERTHRYEWREVCS